MQRKHSIRWGGRAFILATLFALCAALIPNQASAAPLTKKVNFSTAAAVSSCTFTVESVDLTADTVRWKIVATARPVAFQVFTTKATVVYCLFNFNASTPVSYEFFVSGATVNQTKRVTLPRTSLGAINNYCGASTVLRKNGTLVSSAAYTCVPG